MAHSPLARLYQEQESRWRDFLARHFPEARLLRWSPEQRVFRCGHRVMKIAYTTAAKRNPDHSPEYEFSLLRTLEGRALHLNPSYRLIDGVWCVMEIDWIEGESLEELIRERRARKISILQLLAKLFHVSLAGVVYKQLRARHIIRRANGELVFIDFGGSSRANPLVALWRNFAPLSSKNGLWQWGRLVGILRETLRRRRPADGQVPGVWKPHESASPAALRRWQANARRSPRERPEHLANDPGDPVAARHFAAMERCLSEIIQIEPRTSDDLIKFRLANYCMFGNRDWGFIWDHIAGRVDFAGKSVIDLGCGMGGIGAFTRIVGGAHTISLDSQPLLLDAARHFAVALGIVDNEYRSIDWAALANGSEKLPKADIISALSVRLTDLPLERLIDILTQYPEILWQTCCVDQGRRGLEARGYRTVETVVVADVGRYIIHATDRPR